MRTISDTVARMAAFRAMAGALPDPSGATDLAMLEGFGANPGALVARRHVPAGLDDGAPLVVVLHGCTQTAGGYDHGAGWSTLADREGFAVLFPEQKRANNPNLCFNWFMPEDSGREGGEAHSIREMIDAMVEAHALDRGRIYITGLSAGGAMTAVMLAAYPELFAGGAIIAGLPFGSARSVPEAFDRMRGHGGPDDAELAALVRRASRGHEGPWPTVSVWHGTADRTVAIDNMERIVAQWRGVHGTGEAPDAIEPVGGRAGGHLRARWLGEDGRVLIERHEIAGMGHGTPIDPTGPDRLGRAAPHMLDVGVPSTALIARSWGLVAEGRVPARTPAGRARKAQAAPAARRAPPLPAPIPAPPAARPARGAARSPAKPAAAERPGGVQKVIEDALRAAGLMR